MSKEAHGGACPRIHGVVATLRDDDDDDGADFRELRDAGRGLGAVEPADRARMIVAAGDTASKHYSSYHRVFSAARWSLDGIGLAVFDLISPWIDGQVLLAVDDTLARKRGFKMFGCGMHHDPLLSTRSKAIVNWWHSWVVLGVIVELPFRPGHYDCLPILFRL